MKRLATILSFLVMTAIVSGATPVDVCLVNSRYATAAEGGRITLYFPPQDQTNIAQLTATLEYGGEKYEQTFDGLKIWAYATYGDMLCLDHVVRGEQGQDVPYTVTVTTSNGETATLEGTMHFVEPLTGHRGILVEEGTGTWCGNCVRGMVGMEELRKAYPDNFVGVAVHYNDPMQLTDYISPLMTGGFVTAFPMATVNRNAAKALDPYYGVAAPATSSNIGAFEAALREPMTATLTARAEYSNLMETAHVTCTSRFAYVEPGHDYRFGFVVVEDSVHQADSKRYQQANTLAGQTEGGIWAKWESMPSVIPASDMWYADVARSVVAFEGVEGSLPASLETGCDYTFEYDVPFPDNLLEAKRLKIVALILDATTGEVLNATETPFADIATGSLMPRYYAGFKWGYRPEGMAFECLDQLTPYPGQPIAKGEGWKTWYDESEANWLLLSTSYYNGAGRADDWAITPAITLPADSAATLTWRARSSSSANPDGYEVYVSAEASTPQEFLKEAPVLTVSDEDANWATHEINLAGYEGQTVHLAFRNNTYNGERLHLDDIQVSVSGGGDLTAVSAVTDGMAHAASAPSAVYTLDGKAVDRQHLPKGIYIKDGRKTYMR